MIGWCRAFQRVQGWEPVSDAEVAEAVRLARQSIEMGKDDPDSLWMGGYTLAYFAGDHVTGLNAIERALMLNASSAHAWSARGLVYFFLNDPDQAAEAQLRAMRLSPLDPLGYLFTFGLALAHFAACRYEETIEWIDRTLSEQPRLASAVRIKAAASALLDRLEEAHKCGGRLLDLHPGFEIAPFVASIRIYAAPEFIALYAEGLRKAGLPEG
jgi:adenylate cyclase